MHPQFRLWLVTVPEIGTPLPAVLIRYGIKLSWDDMLHYETSVRQSFLILWNKHAHSDTSFKQLRSSDVEVNYSYLQRNCFEKRFNIHVVN